ncbi:MAG: hypothetical protein AAB296_04950 [Candidatus Desantisbacteria bacterium]
MRSLVTKTKMGLWLVGMFIMPSSLLAIPWPVDVEHNDNACFGGAYMDYRYLCNWKTGEEIKAFHHGCDIPCDGRSTVTYTSSENGYIRDINPGEHWISVEEILGGTESWYYGHTEDFKDQYGYFWKIGNLVSKGDRLGRVIKMGIPPIYKSHLEFGKWLNEVDENKCHVGVLNPLEVLDGYSDTRNPEIHDDWSFWDQKNESGFNKAGSDYRLSGKVDIIVRASDPVKPWWLGGKAGIYKIGYEIFDKNNKKVVPPPPDADEMILMTATGTQPANSLLM